MIWEPVLLSLKISSIATVFTLWVGIILAHIFTKYSFKGKAPLETFILLPMVLPPSVVGYGLLLLIGRRGLIGKTLYELFGVSLVFHWIAACIAAVVVSLPLMYQSCKTAFLKVQQDYKEVAMDLGANERKVFWKVTLPLARTGILSGIVLSFARALGEFGATLMVAGNIPGKTQTIPLAVYFAVESGQTQTASILMGIAVAFSFLIIYGLNTRIKEKEFF